MKNSKIFSRWTTFAKGMEAKDIEVSFANHLEYSLSKDQYTATLRDLYHSLALTARDRLVERWIRTQQLYYRYDMKRVYYLSAEYLMGRALINNLINLGIYEQTRQAMEELHIDLEELAEQEPDMGLGNGGLGRLAACFMDSLATLEIPAYGYGIRYEYGIFDQILKNCRQIERPEQWLRYGNPWEIVREERTYKVGFYGRTEDIIQKDGSLETMWKDTRDVIGVAYDIPIDGYANNTVNTLRLWAARASTEFNLEYFQHGDYLKAVEEKNISENISKVLYPNDNIYEGRELRLKQQYFFVSCSIQDIIRRYLRNHEDFKEFPNKVAIQMNDTHPALAVVELMRLLVDVHKLDWDDAWNITVQSCAYTNHTLLSEALEKWPVSMLGNLLPRHLQIIYEINRLFERDVTAFALGDQDKVRKMSLIEDSDGEKRVRMAHLAIVGSHSVNGVAELHTSLLKERELKEFSEMFPKRFNNKTNGITPRRWLLAANPRLAGLVSSKVGEGWTRDLEQIRGIEEHVNDPGFRDEWKAIKRENKEYMARVIAELTDIKTDPDSMFDVQVKRIHEYKRQLLNVLHVVSLWLRIKEGGDEIVPRTFIIGGKAAPSYTIAKLVITLVCQVADMINRDVSTRDRIKLVFLPNYRVTMAEKLIPAADLSEQISTAGFEASGTGNMKFALNGALTIGTLDGANIEIREEVGEENIFIFGLTSDQVVDMKKDYNPRHYYDNDPVLKKAVDLIGNGFFSPDEKDLFRPLVDGLLGDDRYMVMADFQDYLRCQEEVNALYRDDQEAWTTRSILNVARTGKFSSDRTIMEYNRDIWNADTLCVTKTNGDTCDHD